jgi:hypothetical protein
MYARSESGRSVRDEHNEAVLSQHYFALRDYLSGRDGSKGKPPNKAQDKLLRLSPVQFLELSTDVFDELIRRQAASRRPPPGGQGPPPYLMPEQNFHPKRNQARQKLSSLGPPRFRDLATDVYCELERRFPAFADSDIPRPGSNASVRGPPSRTGTPANGMGGPGGFPPRSQSRMRRPSDASSIRGMPPQDPYGVPPSPGLPNGDYGRPMQKQFQSNTIVPVKSTMVEDDDDDTGADGPPEAFGPNGGNAPMMNQETSEVFMEPPPLSPPAELPSYNVDTDAAHRLIRRCWMTTGTRFASWRNGSETWRTRSGRRMMSSPTS